MARNHRPKWGKSTYTMVSRNLALAGLSEDTRKTAALLAAEFKADNPSFDVVAFFIACGLEVDR